MIWKIWQKSKSNSDKIWTIWKKSMLKWKDMKNTEEEQV